MISCLPDAISASFCIWVLFSGICDERRWWSTHTHIQEKIHRKLLLSMLAGFRCCSVVIHQLCVLLFRPRCPNCQIKQSWFDFINVFNTDCASLCLWLKIEVWFYCNNLLPAIEKLAQVTFQSILFYMSANYCLLIFCVLFSIHLIHIYNWKMHCQRSKVADRKKKKENNKKNRV